MPKENVRRGDLQIRPMKVEDLPEVSRIEAEIFSMPWSQKGFEDSLKKEDTYYLTVFFRDKIVGYCGMLQVLDEADITNVAVLEPYRGQGIGFAMLDELLRCGEERGIVNFTLEVRESNVAAIALYEKLGFENCGIRKNFYEKPTENAVIMWKR